MNKALFLAGIYLAAVALAFAFMGGPTLASRLGFALGYPAFPFAIGAAALLVRSNKRPMNRSDMLLGGGIAIGLTAAIIAMAYTRP